MIHPKLDPERRNFRAVLGMSASFFAFALATPAYSQDVGSQDAGGGDAIVVTGTRLARPDLTATSPINIVSEERIALSGSGTIEQTLNQLPQLKGQGGSSSGNTNPSGVYTADLRGLGDGRTLVLVNGRRFVPANTNLRVDLSTIPEALIERVDVVTGGASAVYGSDAVAGVVNFILQDKFDGIKARYSMGISERGDGHRDKADLTIGTNFADDRANVVANFAYHRQEQVLAGSRAFAKVTLNESGDTLIPGGATQIPGGYIPLSAAQRARIVGVNLSAPGCAATGLRFDSSGAPQAFCNPQDLYNFASDNLLIRPQTRYQATLLGHYEISDAITAYAEGYFIRNENSYQIAPVAFTAQNGTSGTLNIPNADVNPSLSAATRAFFAANRAVFDPNNDGIFTVTNLQTRPIELGPRQFDFERTSYQGTLGLRGKFQLGSRRWTWDAYYSYQRLDQYQATYGVVSNVRLAQGLDVVFDSTTGQTRCRSQAAGCVPVNIFGVGSVSPDAASFIAPPATAKTRVTRNLASANVAGELFDLPAGPVAVALGLEYRAEGFRFRPDAQTAEGQTSQGVPQPPNSGDYAVLEEFGEIRIPILADQAFFHELSIEGAFRRSDYSTIGETYAYKGGAQWAVTPWFRLRGAYQRAVRAPDLANLFASQSSGFSAGSDPCDTRRNPSAAVKALCVLQGVPAAEIDTYIQTGTGFNSLGGGNPNLAAEKSDTFTVGLVVNPPFLRGLNITADYYDITVNNAISNVSAQATVDQCFLALDSDNPFCQRISRFSNGDIKTVETSLINVASRGVRGVDVQVDYSLPLPSFFEIAGEAARLNLQFAGNWQFNDKTVPLPGAAPIECSGKFGPGCTGSGLAVSPDFKAQVGVVYASGPFTFSVQGSYIGDIELREGQVGYRDHFPGEDYLDLSMRYRVGDRFEFFGGVNNLFDNAPPLLGFRMGGPVNTSEASYDVVGRRYFVGASVSF